MDKVIGCVKITATKELEFLVELHSKYEKKLEEALLDDRFLVQSEVEKVTEMMKNLEISE